MSEAVVSHAAADLATEGVVPPERPRPNFPAIWKVETPNFLNRIDER